MLYVLADEVIHPIRTKITKAVGLGFFLLLFVPPRWKRTSRDWHVNFNDYDKRNGLNDACPDFEFAVLGYDVLKAGLRHNRDMGQLLNTGSNEFIKQTSGKRTQISPPQVGRDYQTDIIITGSNPHLI